MLAVRPTVGVVVAGADGTAFVVPAYDFRVHVTPNNRSTTPDHVTVAAISDRTLAQLGTGTR